MTKVVYKPKRNTHGGRREGAGRPVRGEPRSNPIWCGQMTGELRNMIIANLTPQERQVALLNAIRLKGVKFEYDI